MWIYFFQLVALVALQDCLLDMSDMLCSLISLFVTSWLIRGHYITLHALLLHFSIPRCPLWIFWGLFIFQTLWDTYFASLVDDVSYHWQFRSAVPILCNVRWAALFCARLSIYDDLFQSAKRFISICLCFNELHFHICHEQCTCDHIHISIYIIINFSLLWLFRVSSSRQCVSCVHELAWCIQCVALQSEHHSSDSQWTVIEWLSEQCS